MADEEVFTYDDLYELLRLEISSKDLQPLSLDILKKIKKYIDSKEKLLEKAESSKFSKEKRRLLEEIDNARRILSNLHQKRVKKIINRAIFTIRSESGAKDTSNMLKFEEELYNKLIKELESNKNEFFSMMKEIKIKEETKELKSIEKEDSEDSNLKKIRILEDIPELTGPDLKNYGPYKKGDLAELPTELAVLIINKNKGRELNENS